MAVLKDAYCEICDNTISVMVDSDCECFTEYCIICDDTTTHSTICNGGTGKRYRFMDWDEDAIRANLKVGPEVPDDDHRYIKATIGDENPDSVNVDRDHRKASNTRGKTIHEISPANDIERFKDQKEKTKFEYDKKKGRIGKLFFDGSRKSDK